MCVEGGRGPNNVKRMVYVTPMCVCGGGGGGRGPNNGKPLPHTYCKLLTSLLDANFYYALYEPKP